MTLKTTSVTILLLALLSGCAAPARNTDSTPHSQTTPSPDNRIHFKGAEYRAQWQDDYNYNTPILIDTHSKWKTFLNRHPGEFTAPDTATDFYSQQFFQDSVVYAYLKSEPSGANQLRIQKAALENDTLKLYMENIIPQIGTMDMATRVCFFGIGRNVMKRFSEVEAVVIRKEE
ncbi:MAG: hypothetical protein ACLFVQ_12130 [Chitinispirillaceae bacterium]